jgi:predicted amidophosphoribosyltransferase
MNCKYCKKEITKDNICINKTLNVSYKSFCSDCYKLKLKKYNEKRWQKIKDARWF